MNASVVSHLYTYPIKSTMGQSLSRSAVVARGLEYDRQWGVFDKDGVAMTGRVFPDLLKISTAVSDGNLILSIGKEQLFSIPLYLSNENGVPVRIFSGRTEGIPVSQAVDEWFSGFLKTPCQFLHINSECHRSVLAKHGGKEADTVNFADQCPLLLLSEVSLSDLNSKLVDPISHRNFRPNIVISGHLPFEEDQWKLIRLGECVFEVNQSCERCVFTTIDPDTHRKHPDQEPLRTLATYRRNASGGPIFGIHLTPRELGNIHVGDRLEIID